MPSTRYISVPYKESAVHAYTWGYRATPGGEMLDPDGEVVAIYGIGGSSKYPRYLGICFRGNGCQFNICLHHLQAICLYGKDAFMAAEAVRHRDGNNQNNQADNIRLGTHQDNQLDIPAEFRRARSIEGCKNAKPKVRLGPAEQRHARELVLSGKNYCEVGRIMGVHGTTIMRLIERRQKAQG